MVTERNRPHEYIFLRAADDLTIRLLEALKSWPGMDTNVEPMTRDTDRISVDSKKRREESAAGRRRELVHRVNRRPSAPDRVTVFPAGASGDGKRSTWLSVNAHCVVESECFR